MKAKRKILITQAQLNNITGSEVITYELARYFLSIDWVVDICVHHFGGPISESFSKLNVGLYSDDNLTKKVYDYVWVHHSFLPTDVLVRNSGKAKFIFHHMSPYEAMEFPFIKSIEEKIASAILANSEETKDMLKSLGVDNRLLVNLANPAPDYFLSNKKALKRPLKSLTVVSNHIPQELTDSLDILRKSGIECRVIGMGHEENILVNESIISKTDLVITIGKTVQYALLSNTPVYLYDRFGGPGYMLQDSDFDKARNLNFSGRGFRKKTAELIAREVVDGFQGASDKWQKFHETHSNDFLLSKKLQSVFALVDKSAIKKAAFNRFETSHSEAVQVLMRRILAANISLSQARNELSSDMLRLAEVTTRLSDANAKLEDLEVAYNEATRKLYKLQNRYKYPEKALKSAAKIKRKIKK